MEKSRLRVALRTVYKCMEGNQKEDGDRRFFVAVSDRTGINGFKLQEGKCSLEIR